MVFQKVKQTSTVWKSLPVKGGGVAPRTLIITDDQILLLEVRQQTKQNKPRKANIANKQTNKTNKKKKKQQTNRMIMEGGLRLVLTVAKLRKFLSFKNDLFI
jgi:hypothetical protein